MGGSEISASQEGWLSRAFELAATAMAVSDLDGRLLEVNSALCQLLQRTSDELGGSAFESLDAPRGGVSAHSCTPARPS